MFSSLNLYNAYTGPLDLVNPEKSYRAALEARGYRIARGEEFKWGWSAQKTEIKLYVEVRARSLGVFQAFY